MRGWREDISEITNALRHIPERIPRQTLPKERYDQLDVARGIAIVLMFLSHTVMALNTHLTLPDYAMVPIHTITKFSSTLFILVFGVTLSLFYVPAVGTESWPKKRNRLIWRAFTVLVWYKILTWVQMFQAYPAKEIWKRIRFEQFTDYAEVLNFYWLAMLWIVLLLPLWKRFHPVLQVAFIVGMVWTGTWLTQNFEFWNIWQIKAMLVEKKGAFCFGQFQRGALALLGLFLGGTFFLGKSFKDMKEWLGMGLLILGLGGFVWFFMSTADPAGLRLNVITAISNNVGKHPPSLYFSLFSFAGASMILGCCLLLPSKVAKWFHPFNVIGRESFFCFNLHFFVIFVLYRYVLGLRLKVSYDQTLWLFAGVVALAYVLSPLNTWIKKKGVLWKWILP